MEEKKDASAPPRKTVLWLYNPNTWSIIYPIMQDIMQDHNIVPGATPDIGFTVCRMHKDVDCIVMPGNGWVDTIVALRKLKPWTPIIVFEVAEEHSKQHYLRSGASYQCDHVEHLKSYLSVAKKDGQLPPMFSPQVGGPKSQQVIWPRTGDRVVSAAADLGYTIGEKLGEGSFGAVYRCMDDFGQRFVIKILKTHKSKEETQVDWEKESRFLLSLRHPNIIELYDMFEYNNLFYMVMEEADGSLKNLVSSSGPLTTQQVIRVAGQLLSGLHHIHARGVIHRDLQTDNVLYKWVPSKSGPPVLQAKISDFGISKFQPVTIGDAGLRAYTSVGRDYDVAPELLTQGYTTQQSDIYQLGLVLFYLYQGKPALGPQDGKSADAIINGVARYRAESIGTPLGNVIARMLRRRAEWRFKNSLEVWAELKAAGIEGGSGSPTPTTSSLTPVHTPTLRRSREGAPPMQQPAASPLTHPWESAQHFPPQQPQQPPQQQPLQQSQHAMSPHTWDGSGSHSGIPSPATPTDLIPGFSAHHISPPIMSPPPQHHYQVPQHGGFSQAPSMGGF